MYNNRKVLYRELAKVRKSSVLVYVTGDRRGAETQISNDTLELFGNLLDNYEGAKKISLFLYTRGGETLAAWGIVNLIREFCGELEIIIPSRCHSAGTLMCLGADRLLMTKQATLGPIDPSTNGPLNPQIPGLPPTHRLPVSVEDVAGFMQMARDSGITAEPQIASVFLKLADHVHPVAIGRVQRTRGQIKDLAKKLLERHFADKEQIDKIIDMLCVEAGSHDYLIYRTEARKSLKLNIETPSNALYTLIRSIYTDIKAELKLEEPFNPSSEAVEGQTVDYSLTRALIESQRHGGYQFKKIGKLTKSKDPSGATVIQDDIAFEGWRYEK